MSAKAQLELHLTLQAGREVECARFLRAELQEAQWAILAALAAELVQEHENRQQGARAILVVGSADQAERVLQDLARAK